MKLECFFHYLKEIATFHISGTCYDTVHIYEYSVKRYANLKNQVLVLYMVAKANKDGFASNNNIKKGFFTAGQAFEYAFKKYNIERRY